MPFPEYERVIYTHNPLTEVVCQLKFPRLLRLESEIPADFQERIKDSYPDLEEKQSVSLEVNTDQDMVKKTSRPVYEFQSKDGKWKIAIASDFVALTTENYLEWGDFETKLSELLVTFNECYQPAYFTRIGLRYKDQIVRSKLELGERAWEDLLNPSISGILGSVDIADNQLIENNSRALIELSDYNGIVHIQHGLVTNEYGEPCYLIDSDFSTSQPTELDNASGILREFNKRAGRLFRWCISDDLHAAMGPKSQV